MYITLQYYYQKSNTVAESETTLAKYVQGHGSKDNISDGLSADLPTALDPHPLAFPLTLRL